jgi:hypothetical protein
MSFGSRRILRKFGKMEDIRCQNILTEKIKLGILPRLSLSNILHPKECIECSKKSPEVPQKISDFVFRKEKDFVDFR